MSNVKRNKKATADVSNSAKIQPGTRALSMLPPSPSSTRTPHCAFSLPLLPCPSPGQQPSPPLHTRGAAFEVSSATCLAPDFAPPPASRTCRAPARLAARPPSLQRLFLVLHSNSSTPQTAVLSLKPPSSTTSFLPPTSPAHFFSARFFSYSGDSFSWQRAGREHSQLISPALP